MAKQKIYKVSSWTELERIVESMDLTKETLTLCGYTFKSTLNYETKKDFYKVWSLFFKTEKVDFIDEDGK